MKLSGKRKVNKMTIGIIVIIVILVIVAALFLLKKNGDRHILDGPGMFNHRAWDLVGVSYSCSGGMEGGYHFMDILPDETGKLIYKYNYLAYNGAEEENFVKEIDENALDGIKEICKNTTCLLYHEGKPSEIQILDAPVTNITFMLIDGNTVSYNNNYEYIPDRGDLFAMVYDELIKIYEQDS